MGRSQIADTEAGAGFDDLVASHPRPDVAASPAKPGDGPAKDGSGGGLVRLTVNLTQRAVRALEHACRLTGDSKTDTVNRALRVYALVYDLAAQGGGSLTIVNHEGQRETIHIL